VPKDLILLKDSKELQELVHRVLKELKEVKDFREYLDLRVLHQVDVLKLRQVLVIIVQKRVATHHKLFIVAFHPQQYVDLSFMTIVSVVVVMVQQAFTLVGMVLNVVMSNHLTVRPFIRKIVLHLIYV
jgi:hypothetical protein